MKELEIIMFVFTFYFTILRYITQLKIFNLQLNNFHTAFGLKDSYFWTIFGIFLWFYQIYFWARKFNII